MTLPSAPRGLGFGEPLTLPDTAPADHGDHVDLLVVGAGISGLLTARRALAEGRSVLVLEAFPHLGRLASGLNNGKVTAAQGQQLSQVADVAGREAAVAYARQQVDAVESMRGLCADLGVSFDVRRAGLFTEDPEQRSLLETEADLMRAAGLSPVLETGDDYAALALVLEGQVQLNPQSLLRALAEDLLDRGCALVGGQRVRRIRSDADRQVVTTTAQRSFTASAVVVATGAPILDRGAHFARMSPQRSYQVAFSGPAVTLDSVLRVDDDTRSVRDVSEGPYALLVGGAGHRVGQAHDEAASIRDIVRWASRWFPEHEPVAQWSAQDYRTHDGRPIVEEVPSRAGSLYVVTGMNKWGLTNAWVASDLLTSALGGESPLPTSAAGLADEVVTGKRAGLVEDQVAVGAGELVGTCRALVNAVTGSRGGRALGVCSHLGGTLVRNTNEGTLDCPLHGSRFTEEGEVLEGYATRAAPTVSRGKDGG